MTKAEKIILPELKHFVLLQRSKSKSGTKSAGSKVGFFCTHILNRQANRLVVCVSSNARKVSLLEPEQHRKPFLFHVLIPKA